MSKWKIYDNDIKEYLTSYPESSDFQTAKFILKHDIKTPEVDTFRTYIKRNRKRILDQFEGTYNATENLDIDLKTVKHLWIKNKEVSAFVKNPEYVEPETEPTKEIDFTNIFKDKIHAITLKKDSNFQAIALFDRLVLTDIHIGMNPNPDGFSLYGGKWDEEELNNRLRKVIDYVVNNQFSNKLIIHDLGDYMDGWDGFTTRGGHSLPQNMDNQKAFDVGLTFKIKLIDSLIDYYNEIEVINICNDNHAGAFGYVVNSAFKSFIELKYPDNVKVINQRKFIDHYLIDNRCFILTHGKDDKSLKFGFKPILDSNQIEKIKNYIDENKLHRYKIEFSKGDSHQLIFDSSTSKHFEYQNFGAFSPPSNWVQTNFQNSISSFTFFNYYKCQKTQYNYIF